MLDRGILSVTLLGRSRESGFFGAPETFGARSLRMTSLMMEKFELDTGNGFR
jgi:hypothetical protein